MSWWEKCYVKEDDFWLCWIVERLDSDTKKNEYVQLWNELLSRGIDYIGEQEILWFYLGMDFDYDQALEALLAHHQYLQRTNFHRFDLVDISDIQFIINWKSFFVHKTDKYGRPVMYSIIWNHRPNECSDELMIKFLFYVNWLVK